MHRAELSTSDLSESSDMVHYALQRIRTASGGSVTWISWKIGERKCVISKDTETPRVYRCAN